MKKMFHYLKNVLISFVLAYRNYKNTGGVNWIKNKEASELIRNTHSIEKGLTIQNPRLGYGKIKLVQMMEEICHLQSSNSSFHKECIAMALSCMEAYIPFHKSHNYTNETIRSTRLFLDKRVSLTKGFIDGGTITLKKEDLIFDTQEIVRFIRSRHSIRDFSNEKVKKEKIMKAFELAQSAPSACNRQPTRLYVLNEKESKELANDLKDIGGFSYEVPIFSIITGKKSSYRETEQYQYIVSPSIFAGYFTLTLHLYGLGACIIQRPVIWTKFWDRIQRRYSISEDEQMIMLIAIGNLKDYCKVPVSHRLNNSEMVTFIGEFD